MISFTSAGTRRAVLAVLLSLVFSAAYLRHSQAEGRLSQDLWYDDITYVVDGARRLEVASSQGAVPFLRTFLQDPPHSPVETTLALLGLAVVGLTDPAVYVANAILLALMALFLVLFFREEPGWLVGLYVLALLASPLAYRTISDFRPDIAVGFTTAAFAAVFLRAVLRNRPWDAPAAALLLGLALLLKPSFFAHTLAVAVAAAVSWGLIRRSGRIETLAGRDVLAVLGGGLLVALPYYAVHGPAMLHYFWSNTRGGESKLWNFPDTVSPLRIAFHFALDRRYGAFSVIGHTRTAAYATVLGGAAWLAWRRRWPDLALPGALLAVGLGSLAIISVGRMDNEFFASTFNVALLLAAFLLAAACARGAGRAPAVVGVLLGVAFVLAGYRSQGLQPALGFAEVAPGHSWNEALVRAIESDSARRGFTGLRARELNVFMTAVGRVSGSTLEWTALKAHFLASFADLHRSESVDELREEGRLAGYVVVPNPAKASLLTFLPAARLQDQILAALRVDPAFERVPAGFADDADRYFLFANLENLGSQASVFGPPVESVSGFLPEEGPYPQWHLQRVRWMTSPLARVCLGPATPIGPRRMRASLRAAVAGTLTIRGAEGLLATVPVSPSERFQEVTWRAAASGQATCLDLSFEGVPAADGRLVLFRRFRVEGAP